MGEILWGYLRGCPIYQISSYTSINDVARIRFFDVKDQFAIIDNSLRELHRELGIPESYGLDRELSPYPEASLDDLTVSCLGFEGRPLVLGSKAAEAWRDLASAAAKNGITLEPFSGFRSYAYQEHLFCRQRAGGKSVDEILHTLAAPGYSEHHTGCAVDIKIPEQKPLERAFEDTEAFQWLQANAASYHFRMSFPEDNRHGFVYEPWHWCYQP